MLISQYALATLSATIRRHTRNSPQGVGMINFDAARRFLDYAATRKSQEIRARYVEKALICFRVGVSRQQAAGIL